MISTQSLCSMKQGWEIKKIGEVCEVIGGSTPKTNEESYWNGEHYWVSPAELDGSKYVYSTLRTITDAGVKSAHLQILPVGTVLLSSRAPIGKVAITKVPMYCNQGFKNLVCGNELTNEYVYWFLLHNTEYLNSLGTGATFKEISKKVVEQIPIPVPPLPEQEKIVSELDCLSVLIEKKRQQLKELDALAQSIFYEMFGNPVENERGWEVERLGNKADISSSKRIFANEYTDSGIPFYRGKEVTEKSKGNPLSIELYISQERYDEIKSNYGVPVIGDILITAVGTIGNIWVVDTDEPFYFKDGNVLWLKVKDNTNPVYFKYILTILINEYKAMMANGCAYSALTIVNLKEMPTCVTPLPLQQTFAQKVEAIEKQKELIKQSIIEAETLLASRMQYYFEEG